MRTVYIDDSTQGVKLGFRQEHDYTEIVYTLPSDWEGVVEAFIKKPGATASVPLTGVTQADGTVSFALTRTDLIVAGRGALEYMCTMNGVVAKSKVFPVIIAADIISESTDRPDEWESWIDELTALAAQVRTDALSAAAAATSASGSASSASQSASGAAQSAQSASESAESASESAQSASESASDAEEAKNAVLNMTATATTLPEGSDATVDYSNGVMAFGIPKGDTGEKGDKGATGETGATPNLSIGTVDTLEPDEDATATITGTAENPVLNLGLPKGETGDVSKAELASLMPLETVSGSVASFSDGSAVFDAEQALITLEPIQSGSGTPSPDNVRPISGHDSASVVVAGRNLLNPSLYKFQTTTRNGLTYTVNNDGSIRVTGTVTAIGGPSLTYNFYLPAGTYSYIDETNQDVHCAYRRIPSGQSSSVALGNPFTTDGSDQIYINLFCKVSSGNIDLTIHPQIEASATATAYEPYQSETYTAQFPSTVYGGTVDLVSGVLTVDRAMVTFDGSNDESWSVGESGTHYRGYTYMLSDIKPRPASLQLTSTICDKIKTGTWGSALDGVFVLGQIGKAIGFGLDSLGITDNVGLRTWLTNNPITVCYELATPQTYQLTPQAIVLLTGDNNVWSDGGSIEVKYRANIGLYVDKKISEVSQ